MMSGDNLVIDWDPDTVEITSKSVENILEPLLTQVTVLMNHKGPSKRKKGNSKQANTIAEAIDAMIKDFIKNGEEVMLEAPERQREFKAALEDVKRTGNDLKKLAVIFLEDPCDMQKRMTMMNATKLMLSAVTRLMILADIVDVYRLLRTARMVEHSVRSMRDAGDMDRLADHWKEYGVNVSDLIHLAGIRQKDLIEDRKKYEIAAARGILKLQTPMLLTSSKAYIRHPELASAKSNRDYVIKSVCDAVEMINTANKGSAAGKALFYEKPGELATILDEFDRRCIMRKEQFNDAEANNLTNILNRVIKDSSVLVSSPCTRETNRQGIINSGKAADTELQNLIKVYRGFARGTHTKDNVLDAQTKILQSTERLRANLKKAVADHISDTFLNVEESLNMLVEAAKSGTESRVESISPYLSETIDKMVEVANLACCVSSDHEGVKITRLSAHQVEQLCPQVINAARVLVLRPTSKHAQENMDVFQTTFSSCLATLVDAVDNITNIWDYLAVVDAHIAADVKQCIAAAKAGSLEEFYQNSTMLTNRVRRLCQAVHGEMEGFKLSQYRNRVEECLRDLEDQLLPDYDNLSEDVIVKLRRGDKIDEAKLIEVANDVYDGVHEIWRSVVFGRDLSGYETDTAEVSTPRDNRSPEVSDSDSEQDLSTAQEDLIMEVGKEHSEQAKMRLLTAKNKEVIDKEMAGFLEQRKRLMHEMKKWDDSSNEIVALAKKMCKIMIDMTEFTRGHGPLKSTMEVIESAGKISELGNQLSATASKIANKCPNSNSKNDLEKYIERVVLYCHQQKITCRVKADIQSIGGEIVVSGLDSVTSLLESSKNLMAAVVETVKASYIASTKYKTDNPPEVQWRVKVPSKKPLVNMEKVRDNEIRRSHRYDKKDPHLELDQFSS